MSSKEALYVPRCNPLLLQSQGELIILHFNSQPKLGKPVLNPIGCLSVCRHQFRSKFPLGQVLTPHRYSSSPFTHSNIYPDISDVTHPLQYIKTKPVHLRACMAHLARLPSFNLLCAHPREAVFTAYYGRTTIGTTLDRVLCQICRCSLKLDIL
jgi:hypothetical protein